MVPLRHGSTVRCRTQAVSFEPALESRHSAIYALDVGGQGVEAAADVIDPRTQRAPQQAANRHNRAECQPILPKVPGWRLRLRAPRPRFCALSNRRLEAAGIEMPHWRDAVARYARWAHSRFPGAVCRQRWTVRLGEVEPVFGQTGRVVLDITARTAHDGALKWTRAPSTPRAARSIFATFPSTCALPSGGRWSLRRVLQRPGRQRKRSSAKSSCGPSRTSSSAPSFHPRAATRGALGRGWRRGERPRAPPAPARTRTRPTRTLSSGTAAPVFPVVR